MQVYIIIALAFAILAVGFTVQNNATVTIHILTHTYQTSIAWVAIVSVFLGALLMAVVDIIIRLTRKSKKKEVAESNKSKEQNEMLSAYERKLETIQGEVVNIKSDIQKLYTRISEMEESTKESAEHIEESPEMYPTEAYTDTTLSTTDKSQPPSKETKEEI